MYDFLLISCVVSLCLIYQINDPTKCGSLRAYFDYDKDFPDDDRICEEVKELQVSLPMPKSYLLLLLFISAVQSNHI
jgi:hypothetical protein